jgi:hypothetical protein
MASCTYPPTIRSEPVKSPGYSVTVQGNYSSGVSSPRACGASPAASLCQSLNGRESGRWRGQHAFETRPVTCGGHRLPRADRLRQGLRRRSQRWTQAAGSTRTCNNDPRMGRRPGVVRDGREAGGRPLPAEPCLHIASHSSWWPRGAARGVDYLTTFGVSLQRSVAPSSLLGPDMISQGNRIRCGTRLPASRRRHDSRRTRLVDVRCRRNAGVDATYVETRPLDPPEMLTACWVWSGPSCRKLRTGCSPRFGSQQFRQHAPARIGATTSRIGRAPASARNPGWRVHCARRAEYRSRRHIDLPMDTDRPPVTLIGANSHSPVSRPFGAPPLQFTLTSRMSGRHGIGTP